MKKFLFVMLLGSLSAFVSCELLEDAIDNSLTEGEVVLGLKEALDIGLGNSVDNASSEGGYLENELIKIILPAEITDLQAKIQSESVLGIPLSTVYDVYIGIENNGNDLFGDLITSMNRGAENAADKAGPIFLNALTNMTIADAFAILDGGETAATDYFYQQTNVALFDAFNPEIKTALDATGANQIYTKTAGFVNYNYTAGFISISPADVLNIDLPNSIDEYATNKAIDGLFLLIGEEEKKIRENPFAWGSSIIERVFGSR